MKILGGSVITRMWLKEGKKQILTTHKTLLKTHFVPQIKHQLHNFIRKFKFWFTRSWMGPHNDENKFKVDEKNNNKSTKKYTINKKRTNKENENE